MLTLIMMKDNQDTFRSRGENGKKIVGNYDYKTGWQDLAAFRLLQKWP